MKAALGAAAGLLLLAGGQALAQAKAAPGTPTPPGSLAGFGWFAELAGSCWKGEHPDGKTADTQCYEVRHGRLLRGTITIAREGAPAFEGEGIFAIVGPEGKRVEFAQWGSGGVYSTGQLTLEADALVFRNRTLDDTFAPVRFVWRRTGPDAFRVVRERNLPDKGWSPIGEVEYRRSR